MIVVNFTHPLNSSQKQKIEELSQRPIQKIVDVPFQLDNQQPFIEQTVISPSDITLVVGTWYVGYDESGPEYQTAGTVTGLILSLKRGQQYRGYSTNFAGLREMAASAIVSLFGTDSRPRLTNYFGGAQRAAAINKVRGYVDRLIHVANGNDWVNITRLMPLSDNYANYIGVIVQQSEMHGLLRPEYIMPRSVFERGIKENIWWGEYVAPCQDGDIPYLRYSGELQQPVELGTLPNPVVFTNTDRRVTYAESVASGWDVVTVKTITVTTHRQYADGSTDKETSQAEETERVTLSPFYNNPMFGVVELRPHRKGHLVAYLLRDSNDPQQVKNDTAAYLAEANPVLWGRRYEGREMFSICLPSGRYSPAAYDRQTLAISVWPHIVSDDPSGAIAQWEDYWHGSPTTPSPHGGKTFRRAILGK